MEYVESEKDVGLSIDNKLSFSQTYFEENEERKFNYGNHQTRRGIYGHIKF